MLCEGECHWAITLDAFRAAREFTSDNGVVKTC